MHWFALGWHGRVCRATWFWRLSVLAVFAIAFGLLGSALFGQTGAALVAAWFVWCSGALSVRRLHDIGSSGWSLLVVLIPIAGPLWLLFRLVQSGVEGRNRYGSDPLARFDYLQVDIAR